MSTAPRWSTRTAAGLACGRAVRSSPAPLRPANQPSWLSMLRCDTRWMQALRLVRGPHLNRVRRDLDRLHDWTVPRQPRRCKWKRPRGRERVLGSRVGHLLVAGVVALAADARGAGEYRGAEQREAADHPAIWGWCQLQRHYIEIAMDAGRRHSRHDDGGTADTGRPALFIGPGRGDSTVAPGSARLWAEPVARLPRVVVDQPVRQSDAVIITARQCLGESRWK